MLKKPDLQWPAAQREVCQTKQILYGSRRVGRYATSQGGMTLALKQGAATAKCEISASQIYLSVTSFL